MARIIKKTMMMMTPPTRTRISPDGRRGRKLTMRPTTMQLMAMRTATKTMMTMPVTMVMTMVMTVAVINYFISDDDDDDGGADAAKD